ncbi:MAG TPA: peroxiredoxin family protein [Candidatus Limnocylindrales bacterium]|nr:peroxiredoxin family protein [Candidatus Limnocylindrales bacterium]
MTGRGVMGRSVTGRDMMCRHGTAQVGAPTIDDGPIAPGSDAPPFSLRDTPHSRVRLEDYRGRALVLVFHVADWHPVATAQLTRLRDLVTELGRLNAAVVAISTDATWSHEAFARDIDIAFPLLADDEPPGATASAYRVHDRATGRSRRAIVVVDHAGVVRWSATFPDAVDPGVDGVLSALEALRRAGT